MLLFVYKTQLVYKQRQKLLLENTDNRINKINVHFVRKQKHNFQSNFW